MNMQDSQLDTELLRKMGAPATSAPINTAAAIDLGIDFSKSQKVLPQSLTADECIRKFGTRDAVLMNFIPQMLTALALEQAESYLKYCADNRLREYKRHNRQIRICIEEYNRELKSSYGRSWQAYQMYLSRLRSTIEVDLFKCWCTFTNEAARQYVGHPHKEIPARIAFIMLLLKFVETFDKNIDGILTEKLGTPCGRKRDPYIECIAVLCLDIAEVFGQKIQVTDTLALCVKVLANRCRSVVDDIIVEEDESEVRGT